MNQYRRQLFRNIWVTILEVCIFVATISLLLLIFNKSIRTPGLEMRVVFIAILTFVISVIIGFGITRPPSGKVILKILIILMASTLAAGSAALLFILFSTYFVAQNQALSFAAIAFISVCIITSLAQFKKPITSTQK